MNSHYFDKLNRLPPYNLAEVIDLMKSARRDGNDVIDLGMGNPDLPTPPHVVEKICEAARNPKNHRYSSSRGIPNLRAAITDMALLSAAASGKTHFSGSMPSSRATATEQKMSPAAWSTFHWELCSLV